MNRTPYPDKDPTLPSTAPKHVYSAEVIEEIPRKRFIEYFYNKEKQEYCGRTLKSWVYIIGYAILYLIFLTTFFLVMLYLSLLLLKKMVNFQSMEPQALVYPESDIISLTAVPTSENSHSLIWYKVSEKDEYEKYVLAIEKLLNNKETKPVGDLGPCDKRPYGYGKNPCVIIKVNKRFHWSGKPLQLNSTESIPSVVKEWIKSDNNKLWLQCNGYHPYDHEHIGNIKYYPDPPGLDPALFPLKKNDKSPLLAIQISDFSMGLSLAIECKFWYNKGPSRIDFVLYVMPDDSLAYNAKYNVL